MCSTGPLMFVFFFNASATPELYTLSLHDALPILFLDLCSRFHDLANIRVRIHSKGPIRWRAEHDAALLRSEEHTSELQSPDHLVCRLLLEKKKKKQKTYIYNNKYTNVYNP